MYMTALLVLLVITVCCCLVCVFLGLKLNARTNQIDKNLSYQYNLIVKMQSILKNKTATNAVAENAEFKRQHTRNGRCILIDQFAAKVNHSLS